MPPDDFASYLPNNVPSAVRRQIAEAEEMARQAGVANVPDAPEGAERAERPQSEQQAQQQGEPPAPDQVHDGSEFPPQEPAPAEDNWEHKYKSLQGRFESERQRAAEMRGELNSLREVVTSLQRQPQAQPQANQPPPSQQIPQADVDSYGPELIEAAQRWAEARVANRMQEYERRLLSMEGQAHQMQAVTAQQRCEAELDRQVPGWRQTNERPEFISWLNDYDPFSGQQRMALIQDAYAAGNAARCAAFFRAYSQEASVVSPSPGISPTPSPAPGSGAGVPLAQLAAPGRGSGPLQSPSAPPTQRQWTGDDITRLSREWQRGLWNGREAEYTRRWEDAIAAGREGRYRPPLQ